MDRPKLACALADIYTRWGTRAVRKLGKPDMLPLPHLATGFITLDRALGIGGLPRDHVSESCTAIWKKRMLFIAIVRLNDVSRWNIDVQLRMNAYVELHCHSYFSLLDGASSPEALIQRAAALGMSALALTDHDAVYGAVRFDKAARAMGMQPMFGAELTLDGEDHLTLLVTNESDWRNLCWLISQARQLA